MPFASSALASSAFPPLAPSAVAGIRPDALGWTARATQPAAAPANEALDFRQLRHQSKNALQRLLCEVSRAGESQTDWRHRRLLADLERRLLLSAKVSDALFGFTAHPGPFEARLRTLAEATVELLADGTQSIAVSLRVDGTVREPQAQPLLRIAHEMIGNAVKHGLDKRLVGRVELFVAADVAGTRLVVRDDGWGPPGEIAEGGGTAMARELAGEGADLVLRREADWTIASATLPGTAMSGAAVSGAPAGARDGAHRSERRMLGLMAVWPILVALPAAAILTSWCCGVL